MQPNWNRALPLLHRSLQPEVRLLVQPAVLVSDHDVIGPARRRVDEEAKPRGIFGDVESKLGGVGAGGLERRQQGRARDRNRSILAAGGVDQPHFAR